jgi:hypothetical protein
MCGVAPPPRAIGGIPPAVQPSAASSTPSISSPAGADPCPTASTPSPSEPSVSTTEKTAGERLADLWSGVENESLERLSEGLGKLPRRPPPKHPYKPKLQEEPSTERASKSAAQLWEGMERMSDRHQIEGLEEPLKKHGPRPQGTPYKPKFQEQARTSLPKSTEWYRQVISLGSQMASQETRRILALKTQEVWSKMGKSGPPPDIWSALEESARYQRPPRTAPDQNHR